MRLHANWLDADSIDDLVTILQQNDLRIVTLDHAWKDPAYTIADTSCRA
jgi:hypothetical protein